MIVDFITMKKIIHLAHICSHWTAKNREKTAFKAKRLRDDISVFFMRVVRDAVEQREENNVSRNDLFHGHIDQSENSRNERKR